MSLRAKQSKFVRMVGLLIDYAHMRGYELTFGDAYRDPRTPYGHPRSLHKSRLAIDLNVFKAGEYLGDGGEYDDLGEFWEGIGGSWGGRFGDDNHFSLSHEGMD